MRSLLEASGCWALATPLIPNGHEGASGACGRVLKNARDDDWDLDCRRRFPLENAFIDSVQRGRGEPPIQKWLGRGDRIRCAKLNGAGDSNSLGLS